jgi:hypothetical protein
MNKNEFMEGIRILQRNYNQTLDKEKLRLFYENLKDMSREVFLANVNKQVRTNSFMPNIAQLRGESSKELSNFEQRSYTDMDFESLYSNKE